jgi:hypothetical protein
MLSLPWAMIGAQGRLRALGYRRQRFGPFVPYCERLRVRAKRVQSCAPYAGYLRDVGGAALPSLDLDGLNARLGKLRQQLEGIQARGLFQNMLHATGHTVSALAYHRITGDFSILVTIYEQAVEP